MKYKEKKKIAPIYLPICLYTLAVILFMILKPSFSNLTEIENFDKQPVEILTAEGLCQSEQEDSAYHLAAVSVVNDYDSSVGLQQKPSRRPNQYKTEIESDKKSVANYLNYWSTLSIQHALLGLGLIGYFTIRRN